MATLKDVAKLANVDVSTVSRALNNTSYVHPDTRKRIYDAVKELSYHPNVLAQGLRQGKKHTIAFVIPRISNAVYIDMIPSICEAAREKNYQCIICVTGDDENLEKDILTRLRGGTVDGIIITSTGKNNRLLREMESDGICVLQTIRKQDEKLSSVIPDYNNNGYEAVKYLYSRGSRHIGLVIGNLALHPYMERYDGYQKAIKELNLESIVAMDDGEPSSFEYGYVCTEKLFESCAELDGILVSLDIQGLGAQRALKDMNKKVPSEVKLVSLTGMKMGSYLETKMTSMEVPAEEMGREAVNLLIQDIETKSEHRSLKRMVFSSTLVERETS